MALIADEKIEGGLVSDLDALKDIEAAGCAFVPTGFERLDSALDSGLYSGLYIIGAMPSLGKTTLVKQVADQIAAQGQDVLFFSLEMARRELIAKSISRQTHLLAQGKRDIARRHKTAREIMLRGLEKWESEADAKHVKKAYEKYKECASHIFTFEGNGEMGTDSIRARVREYVEKKQKSPVVIVDYLQILAPSQKNLTDKQMADNAIVELKRISRDFCAPVVCISSFNRGSYSKPLAMEAFKESGSIEYSSDVLLGLQYAGGDKKEFDIKAAMQKNPRSVNLVVLKNRNGEQGALIEFDYYPQVNYFEEAEA